MSARVSYCALRHPLHSSFCVPVGARAFSSAATSVWNSLPEAVRSSSSLTLFRKSLTTELFTRSYVGWLTTNYTNTWRSVLFRDLDIFGLYLTLMKIPGNESAWERNVPVPSNILCTRVHAHPSRSGREPTWQWSLFILANSVIYFSIFSLFRMLSPNRPMCVDRNFYLFYSGDLFCCSVF